MSENKNKIHNVWDRFKLKKDLPTWEAGEEMWIWEDWCLYWTTKEWDVIMVYHVSTILNFDILNSDWFEKIEKSIFDLKEWDNVYYINEDGNILKKEITNKYIDKILNFVDIWNVFLKEEEVEAELERRKALQRIKKFMWENWIKNIKFNENIYAKYIISYDDNVFEVGTVICNCWEILWFFEEEDCQKIIDNCEEDLKIIYNIKD